jgi:hypothetical protein
MKGVLDLGDPVVRLCLEGSRAELEGRRDDARALYENAWEAASDDYEACIAAHYVARFQARPEDVLRWNQEALCRADAVDIERVREFYPSLYLNLGRSHELLGNQAEAEHYYYLAARLGFVHQPE